MKVFSDKYKIMKLIPNRLYYKESVPQRLFQLKGSDSG